MRVTGLCALLVGVIFMLLPFYTHQLPFVSFSADDGRLVGGLLVALGAIALAISRQSES
jgi:hypothetical protein